MVENLRQVVSVELGATGIGGGGSWEEGWGGGCLRQEGQMGQGRVEGGKGRGRLGRG